MFFVNSMSDFFHEDAPDEWRTEALAVMAATPHQYQILTKRPEVILAYLERTGVRLPMNAWIGVTIERGDFVDRLDVLREVPAEIRFVSAEPLLGALGPLNLSGIHWIITGGESGPGARPMNADWIREIREQCLQQDVAHFFKQWGKLENNPLYSDRVAGGGTITWARQAACEDDPHGKGGSLLDGRHWKQYPNHEIQAALL
jgi:protein gp37